MIVNIRKSMTVCLLAILFFIVSAVPSMAQNYENLTDLGLQSKSAILMDTDTGSIIYEQNSHEKLPPASVTKVMTLLLVYEGEANGKFRWEDMVSVSEHAASMGGSQVFLEPYEQQSASDMTKCIAIASANDAAVAMAELIGGSEEGFVELMNKRASELGMADTHFVNACGLDADGHVTSANDIAIMSRELMKNFPEITKYTSTWQDSITHKTKKGESEFGLNNTNKLLKWYAGATGLKTGSTGKALYCLSGTAEKDGLKLIGVVMAAPDFKIRFQEVMKLLDYGYANYATSKGLPMGEVVGEVQIYKGMEEEVNAVILEEASVLAPKGNEFGMESQVNLLPYIKAPFAKGTKVGEIIYTINGKEAARTDVVAQNDVEKANISIILQRLLSHWCA